MGMGMGMGMGYDDADDDDDRDRGDDDCALSLNPKHILPSVCNRSSYDSSNRMIDSGENVFMSPVHVFNPGCFNHPSRSGLPT